MSTEQLQPILPIERYLPQRHPFIMVEKLTTATENGCATRFAIQEDNIMLVDNHLSEGGILENIAQTCAAHIGYLEIHIRKNLNIRIGVVGLYKGIQILRYPTIGETIETTVEANNYGELSIYTAQVECNGETIAQGEVRVVLTDKFS